MYCIDQTLLERRFDLRNTLPIFERFEKSPNITEQYSLSAHHQISYSVRDTSILTRIVEPFLRAYRHVKKWFEYRGDIALDLWMAPSVVDLQYMTCLPCDPGYFCAPGSRNGMNTILFVSPRSCIENGDKKRLASCLAHEIAHHLIREISGATTLTMQRREKQDVPMWLEEGICQIIQADINPSLQNTRVESIGHIKKWYGLEELYNDLSCCEDTKKAYLQAYKEAEILINEKGKEEVIRLLHLNRTQRVAW